MKDCIKLVIWEELKAYVCTIIDMANIVIEKEY